MAFKAVSADSTAQVNGLNPSNITATGQQNTKPVRPSLTPDVELYLRSVIDTEIFDIMEELGNLQSMHSAFSQLVQNRVVEHCCQILSVDYSSSCNQLRKFPNPHPRQPALSMNNIIQVFGKLQPSTFSNHRGTHFLALKVVKLLTTHVNQLEVQDADFLKHMNALLMCKLELVALRALARTPLGGIDALQPRLTTIWNKYNR
jgi:hypothetical protein